MSESKMKTCPECEGRKEVFREETFAFDAGFFDCPTCDGAGVVSDQEEGNSSSNY